MKKNKRQSLCLMFLLLICVFFCSCELTENILQSTSAVDFCVPQKVQISFDEHIYDTTIIFSDTKLEMNFDNEKDLLNGVHVCLTENDYRITHTDMVFEGEKSSLTNSFLPCVVYSFFTSLDERIFLDNYDKTRQCYFVKRSIGGYFITLECYDTNGQKYYSMEIK